MSLLFQHRGEHGFNRTKGVFNSNNKSSVNRIMADVFVKKTQGERIVKDVYHCIITNHGDLELLVKVR